jgi:peptidoglycan/LPS O-acetylase OafA/YrhL
LGRFGSLVDNKLVVSSSLQVRQVRARGYPWYRQRVTRKLICVLGCDRKIGRGPHIREFAIRELPRGRTESSRASRVSSLKPAHFRKDIEGLRAVAVILVVLDHIGSWPRAGFVGVDVFFVISGFLITGLLLNESELRGRISIHNFYERRARRILPAALTVLFSSLLAAHLVFRGTRVKDALVDIYWALGFSANIHFADIGTDYFQVNRPPSLVQHFWSLAVEEQFYLVWPLVMLIVLTLIRRRTSTTAGRSALLVIVGAGTVTSFGWAMHQTAHFPAAAYFSTPVRAWELGTGALVAVAAARFPSIPQGLGRARGPLSALGLAGIVAGALFVTPNSGFPAPSAALPVLATALVIVAGIGAPLHRWTGALTNRATTYIGRVSFSLYLWHWPVIVVVGALIPKPATVYYPVVLMAAAALTIFSYHFIESPLRTAKFSVLARPQTSRVRRTQSRPKISAAQKTAALASFSLTVAVLGMYALQPVPPSIGVGPGDPLTEAWQTDSNIAQPRAALARAITAAAAATNWPTLDPSLDHLGTKSAFAQWQGCSGATEATLSGCTFGNADNSPKVAVLIGDSYAMAWLPSIRTALVPQNWIVYGLTKEQCPAAFVSVRDEQNPPQYFSGCDSRHSWMISETARLKPNLVILASAPTMDRLASSATGPAAEAEWQGGMEKTIRSVQSPGSPRILTLSPPPSTGNLPLCATATAPPSSCLGKVTATWKAMRSADAAAAAATKTAYADTHLWFCTFNLTCPSFVGSTPVTWDGGHLTSAYASSLGPEMAGVIAEVMK